MEPFPSETNNDALKHSNGGSIFHYDILAFLRQSHKGIITKLFSESMH